MMLRNLKNKFTVKAALFYLVFYGVHVALFVYGWYTQQADDRLAALNKLKLSVWVSRGAGLVLALDGGLILLPMLRNVIHLVRSYLGPAVPLDENIWFHKQVAYMLLFWTIVHVTAHYVNFINVERMQLRPVAAWQIHYAQAGGITGHVMMLAMFLLYSAAHVTIRHQKFELFWYIHQITALIFMLSLFTHATGCFVRDSPQPDFRNSFPFYSTEHCLGYESWRFIIWPFIAYIFERVFIEIRARFFKTNITNVFVHPGNTIEIRFEKPSLKYKSGQYIWIQLPELSKFQWHPFTITSAPEDDFTSIHVRQVGDFSKSLGPLFGIAMGSGISKQDQLSSEYVSQITCNCEMPRLMVDGPYGAPADNALNKEVAVLIGAGIGVTPFASILKSLWYRKLNQQLGVLKRVEFYWICRETESFIWFKKLLTTIEEGQKEHTSFININIYLTKWKDEMIHNISLNDVGAKSDPLTNLQCRTRFGRPEWRSVYSDLKSSITRPNSTYLYGREAHLKTNIATFFCGPPALARSIQEAIKEVGNDAEVKFSFFKESF